MTPGLTGPLRAEGFPVEDERMLPVKLPSGGFGHSNAKIDGRQPGAQNGFSFQSPMAFHKGGLGRAKKPFIQELLPPALWSLRTG
jgi:hypothetical protein